MNAIVIEATGGPEQLVLRDVAEPEAGEGHTVVEVRAAAVNFADALIRQGRYPQMPELPFVPGSEVAGVTADGRRIVGFVRGSGGGYAQRAVVEDGWLFDLPAEASFEEGAAFLLAFLTAWLPLTRQVNVRPGVRVLVHAAAGGVGSAAVQAARALGAEVVATAGSEEKLELPRSLGASEAVTYDRLDELEQVDVVFDPVGGELFASSLKLLRPLGTAIAIGYAAGPWQPVDPTLLVGRNLSVAGFYLGRLLQLRPDVVRAAALDLVRFWQAGAAGAHRLLETGLDGKGGARPVTHAPGGRS